MVKLMSKLKFDSLGKKNGLVLFQFAFNLKPYRFNSNKMCILASNF